VLDHEAPLRVIWTRDEVADGVERMDDGETQPSIGHEYPSDLSHCAVEVVHVVERHERHREVNYTAANRKSHSVTGNAGRRLVVRGRSDRHPPRRVNLDDVMAASLQVATHAPLTTSDIKGDAAGGGE
jgi:hypothetical protein